MSRRILCGCSLLAVLTVVGTNQDLAAEQLRQRYVEGLRRQGFADLAIEYLQLELARPNLAEDERAEIEFEIAASLVSATELLGDLSKREQMLEDARQKFAEFSQKHPTHPRRTESLMHVATVDLQRGRLSVVQAQLPANATRVLSLAEEARRFLRAAAQNYDLARTQAETAYKKMPVYIDDERPEGRKLRQEKSRLFDQYIEARFQAELARFYLADSFRSIVIPEPKDSADSAAVAAHQATKAEWAKEYQKAIAEAERGFEQIYVAHRRELVGLFGHLWMARCMAARSEHRKAMGVFTQLMEHDNRELARFQRDVFYFMILSFMARQEYDQVITQAEEWLRRNVAFAREPSYQGVQLELARAYIAVGKASKDDKTRRRYYFDANSILDRLRGDHQGLARREQLQIAGYLTDGDRNRNFNQLFSLASAKLDEIKPTLPPERKSELLQEAKSLLRTAIRTARNEDPVQDAQLSLVYAMMQSGELYDAAVLAEHIARARSKTAAAPQAALFGVTAYAWAFEDALKRQQAGVTSDPDTDIRHLVGLTDFLRQRWPESKEAAEALMILGRLHLSRQQYSDAITAFEAIGQRSVKFAEAQSLAGRSYWDWFLSLARKDGSNPQQLTGLREKAKERLHRAAQPLLQESGDKVTLTVFLNQAALGEALYESTEDEAALHSMAPLVDAIAKNACPAEVEPPLRIRLLTTALQSFVRLGKLEQADGIVDLIGKQPGQEQAGNVTAVLVNLASRLKEQITRLETAGDSAKTEQTVAAFERFLDNIAAREAGQSVPTLVFLGNSFVELRKYDKAVATLERAVNHPQAGDKQNEGSVLFARLLLARSHRRTGDYAAARKAIDQLYLVHRNHLPILMERGEILEAAGDNEAAIRHWKDIISRMQRTRPRPEEFYQAMDRLLRILKDERSANREKRLREGYKYAQFLVQFDTGIPEDWKTVFTNHVNEIAAELRIQPQRTADRPE